VSAMISTALIPRLCKIVEGGAFDAYSTKGVRRLRDLAEQLEASVEGDGTKFQVRSVLGYL
jgi:GC-rich sequence DNA-binding factor